MQHLSVTSLINIRELVVIIPIVIVGGCAPSRSSSVIDIIVSFDSEIIGIVVAILWLLISLRSIIPQASWRHSVTLLHRVQRLGLT